MLGKLLNFTVHIASPYMQRKRIIIIVTWLAGAVNQPKPVGHQ